MKKLAYVIVATLLLSGHALAEPKLTEDVVKSISAELRDAVHNADITVFEKYLYPGTRMVIDMDPSPDAGETEIQYEQYMQILTMSLPMMRDADIDEEVLSISVDEAKNEATIREKTSVTAEMMGTKVREVSITETTYGVVDGEIKALSATDQLISSGVVN